MDSLELKKINSFVVEEDILFARSTMIFSAPPFPK
jgi:hypothetical protein